MDAHSRTLSKYIKEKGINLAKMSRDTEIPYVSLYDSLMNPSRQRELRVREFFKICDYLEVSPMDFRDEPGKEVG